MRIIGGTHRGRKLQAPKGDATRPTSDRIRESLFNILGSRIEFENSRVLDLFAGTGALGLEALSRGAAYALFVEQERSARQIIEANIEALMLAESAEVTRRDASRLGQRGAIQPFDLVFVDPPYAKGMGEQAVAAIVSGDWIKPKGLLVLEESSSAFVEALPGFTLCDLRQFGRTTIGMFISLN